MPQSERARSGHGCRIAQHAVYDERSAPSDSCLVAEVRSDDLHDRRRHGRALGRGGTRARQEPLRQRSERPGQHDAPGIDDARPQRRCRCPGSRPTSSRAAITSGSPLSRALRDVDRRRGRSRCAPPRCRPCGRWPPGPRASRGSRDPRSGIRRRRTGAPGCGRSPPRSRRSLGKIAPSTITAPPMPMLP